MSSHYQDSNRTTIKPCLTHEQVTNEGANNKFGYTRKPSKTLSKLLRSSLIAVLSLGSISSACAMTALFTTFSDRTTYEAALSGVITEGFSDFTTEENFRNSALDIGDFTLSVTGGGDSVSRQFIDIPPESFLAFVINGTNQVSALVRENVSVVVNFDSPTLGFGADFGDLNNVTDTSLTIGTNSFSPAVLRGKQFFGVTSDTPFLSVIFRGIGDGFSFDDVSYTQVAAVPIPPAVLLLGSALVSMVWFRRRP